MDKSPDAFRTISEAVTDLDVPQHVLRFWETRFTQIKPMKRGGGRRYYRPEDIELLKAIRHLLYGEGYTIKGVQRLLKEQGVKAVIGVASGTPLPRPATPCEAVPQAPRPRFAPVPEELDVQDDPTETIDGPADAISPDGVQQLRAALADISECLRILAAANP
jgi:DNA-binding transcriptional MerR regulator